MNILIANDGPTAFYYIRLGLARAFNACGHNVIMWDIRQEPPLDMFDTVKPDIFIGQTYNMTRSLVQAIKENPQTKVIMKAGDWGPLADEIDTAVYPILKASDQEIKTVLDLHEETSKPDYVHIHYHPDYIEGTHGYWQDHGVPTESILNAADIFDYTIGSVKKEFYTDLAFVGGYWGYKAQTFDKWLLPLCGKYQIKIFGNQAWPIPEYCGFIPNEMIKDVFASALICPNLSEPHSQVYGFDVIERPFKLLSSGAFVISDYVEGLEKLFPNGEIQFAKTPAEFKDLVDHYLQNPDQRHDLRAAGYAAVLQSHTYFHRVIQIFDSLRLPKQAQQAAVAWNQLRNK